MQINIKYDASVDTAPAGFKTAVNYAVNYLDALITDNIQVTIYFGWGAIDSNTNSGSGLPTSVAYPAYVDFNQPNAANTSALFTALAAAYAQNGFATAAPAANVAAWAQELGSYAGLTIGYAEAKALGLDLSGNFTQAIGQVIVNPSYNYNFDPSTAGASGSYDLIDILLSQITSTMGRSTGYTSSGSTYATLLDFFRYSAENTPQLKPGGGYFSTDGSFLTLPYSNQVGAAWSSQVKNDADGSPPTGHSGADFTIADMLTLMALGFHIAPSVNPDPQIDGWFASVLRESAVFSHDASAAADISSLIGSGLISSQQALNTILDAAESTTSVATMAYQFFTGQVPSAAGMDYLVSPSGPNANNLNGTYYQSFSGENRYINFAVNLGAQGAGAASFAAKYGTLNLFDATRQAYAAIFGATPSDDKIHTLLDPTFVLNGVTMSRADYFAYYGQDGANGTGTKAAMVGWLLSEAVKADIGDYALSNDAFLTDVAKNGAAFGVNLIGQYDQPGFHITGG